MIHIVDYGLGNIGAFLTLYKRQAIPAVAVSKAEELAQADHILLPGVGSFDYAMQLLNQSGMRETLDHLVKDKGVPVLGICVGMQILGDASDEGKGCGSRLDSRSYPRPRKSRCPTSRAAIAAYGVERCSAYAISAAICWHRKPTLLFPAHLLF